MIRTTIQGIPNIEVYVADSTPSSKRIAQDFCSIMPATLLQLDLDIIAGILAQMEPMDALRMTFTCRAAYRVAHPRALSDITIDAGWQKDGRDRVDMFSNYMLERPRERIVHLKSLIIESDTFAVGGSDPESGETYVDFNFTSAGPLSVVVQLASRLRRLHIGGSEFIFGSVPELAKAMASLTSLRELSITHVGRLAADVLSKMQCRPRGVQCSIISLVNTQETRRHSQFVPGRHHLLHNLTASLKVLRLENADVLPLLEGNTIWPYVHELHAVCSTVLNLEYLGKAFPNLRRLETEGTSLGPVQDAALWPQLDHLTVHRARLHITSRVRSVNLYLRIGPVRLFRDHRNLLDVSTLLDVMTPVILDVIGSPELFKCAAGCAVAKTLKFVRGRVYVHPSFAGSGPLATQMATSLDEWIVCLQLFPFCFT